MKTIIHKAESRGRSRYDWLDSRHNFSFAGYMDRERVHFGALRVLNDDIVQPGTGFGRHPHDNMEIISIPIQGALKHQDSMNHEQIIEEHEIQVMSAGTGLFHAEYNASETEAVNFLQLWIYPDTRNVKPVYDQKKFDPEEARNRWQTLVSSMDEPNPEILKIHQQAKISRTFLDKGHEINYTPGRTSYGSFLFIVHGKILYKDETFSNRDAVGVRGNESFSLRAIEDAYIINIEVPDIKLN
ncbi:MAG: pirin family protein [bacterium]